jgi:hypothetical protein
MSDCADLQNKYNSLVDFQQLQQDRMQQQITSMSQINDIIEKANSAIICGPECQRQKQADMLRQKYLDAQTNLQTAPINLENSRKEYYVFTEGQPYYDNLLEQELKQKAEIIAKLLTESFNDELASAITMNEYYKTDVENCKNTQELLIKTIEENDKLQLELRKTRGDILTNDRKTYYENNASDKLDVWYKFWWYVYYIAVIILLIALVMTPSSLSIIVKVLLFILVSCYPYYISYIIDWIYAFITSIRDTVPKSVYNKL